AITGPAQGARVTRYVRLNGKSPASYGSVTWNYRRATTDAWTVVPAGDVTKAGTGIGSWPVTLTASGATATAPELVWDAKTSLGKDTPILLQACYTPTGGGNASCTADSAAPTVTLDQLNAGNVDSTTKVAGGTADLLTGNFAITQEDISVAAPGASLAVSRTFNSADPTRTTNQATGAASAFGPGWTTGLPVGSANSDWTGVSDYGSVVAAYDSGGAAVFFAQQSGGGYKPVGDDADSGLTLTAGSAGSYGPTSFTVADPGGNATKFDAKGTFTGNPSPDAPHPYQVSAVTQPGNAQTTTYTYDTSGRVTQILAPVPAESTCTGATVGSGQWSGGCKALNLTYGTSGTANGRLTAVTLRTTSTAGTELDVDVACYAYDAAARLAAVWDPRDGTAGTGTHPVTCSSQVRPTAYTYDAAGRIATITPPGLARWNLAYDANGRLDTVSRTHDSAHGGGSETTQVVYGVATTADATHGEYRPDLGATAIAGWGQKEAPVTATAVFGPGHTASSTDLRGAAVSYLNAEGRTVNTANYSAPGGIDSAAGWHVDTTDYDSHGNVVRTLTAKNRDEALNPTNTADPNLVLPTDTVAAAGALSTVNVYSYDAASSTSDLTDSYGPYHLVTLADGTITPARQHTHTSYDTGSETGHPAGGLLHLPVTVTVGASRSADPIATNETDVRTTSNDYALSASDATGWKFRKPMRVTTDPGSGHLAISSVTRFDDATGAVIETRQPRSTGNDAATTQTVYYTDGANTADPACGNKPAWSTLVCETRPAAQPGVSGLPGLPTQQITGYDYLGRATTTVEAATPGWVNVAAGKASSASSVETTGFEAAKANDANTATRWSSAHADNQWWQVDLGVTQSISVVDVAWETAYASSYQVQTSTDGTTWTTVGTQNPTAAGTQRTTFTAVNARYVRINCLTRATAWGFSIWEVAVYGNFAQGKAATASSVETTGFEAAKANDGSTATRWSSTYADNQWWQVDLGTVQSINAVDVAWETAYASSYQVQTSTDGTTWTTVGSQNPTAAGTQRTTFTPVNARYVRINCLTRATACGFSIWEVLVYGDLAAAGTTQTRTTTATYTNSGYGTDPAGTTITSTLGTAVPATTIDYDPATGLA
ncbi:MAG TPA: discoidin domain-containing protein, partial [Kineosporiaceae bacterium]|nr:discoidin domain-containing protein [Kineosporiaceae bacterium]